MRSFLTILLSAFATAAAAGQTYELQVDPKATSLLGKNLYVGDDALKAAIPSLRNAGGRISTCITSIFRPASGYIDFAPSVTGPHAAVAHRLLCSTDKITLRCMEAEDLKSVVFDSDPAESFQLGDDVALQDALSIYRALRDRQVEFPAGQSRWIQGLPLRRVARDGDHFIVLFADCGCSEQWQMELRPAAAGTKVIATHSLKGICN